MGYRSDSIAISRDVGPLKSSLNVRRFPMELCWKLYRGHSCLRLAVCTVLESLFRYYNQLRQDYLDNYFQAKVGKELPKQFPEPLSVGKLDVVIVHS